MVKNDGESKDYNRLILSNAKELTLSKPFETSIKTRVLKMSVLWAGLRDSN